MTNKIFCATEQYFQIIFVGVLNVLSFNDIHPDVLWISSSRNQFRLKHHLLSNYLIYRLHVSARLSHLQAFTFILTQIQIF
jgi:hypothetical protein